MSSSPSSNPIRPPSYPQILNHTLTLAPSPLVPPTRSSPHILVLGAGVAGLSTAWTLLDHGYRVTVVAADWASYTETQRMTSQIAGALWEYPPAVCGQHTDAESLEKAKGWCMLAYGVWSGIAAAGAAAAGHGVEQDGQASDQGNKGKEKYGVQMRTADFFFKSPVHETPGQLAKMQELAASGVHGFKHNGPAIIAEQNIPPAVGVVDAYTLQAPVIDTDVSMAHLLRLVVSKGAKLITRRITGRLTAQEDALLAEFHAAAIINCTGLGSAEVASDGKDVCFGLRGAVLRVINDGTDFPKVETALCIPATGDDTTTDGNGEGDTDADEGFVFILPRNDNILLLGGFAEHTTALDLTPTSPIVQRMRARCEAFLPGLQNARLDPAYPLAQGLRPFRKGGVRVEREGGVCENGDDGVKGVKSAKSRIVHNYGHGGAGWSLSFGCAVDVLRIVGGIVEELDGGGKA